MPSQSEQDYLKAIYEVVHEGGQEWASTTGLAHALGLAPASVTAMLKKLAGQNPPLVLHELYQGVRLTEAGERAALEVVRHHRLLESFLSAALGYTWDKVHAEAHRLEHAISEDLEDHIASYLGEPARDPHGAPIPRRDGAMEALDDLRLTDLPLGQPAARAPGLRSRSRAAALSERAGAGAGRAAGGDRAGPLPGTALCAGVGAASATCAGRRGDGSGFRRSGISAAA